MSSLSLEVPTTLARARQSTIDEVSAYISCGAPLNLHQGWNIPSHGHLQATGLSARSRMDPLVEDQIGKDNMML
ncbi:hypothetical protein PHLCEN_2v9645 [Hermanssonia centrifuga]|uniref:Uncharacterized protein n=1 Tax=Hermanssonia centrifuga TaxID=98765 RepID=A0A2R6NQ83_9APHY|nr:hypothetical protein PHLCEN_2v9645 [Hermanssonia centrifuga]